MPERRRLGTVVPKPDVERRRADETKQIRLVDVLMRAPLDTGFREGDVRHCGVEFLLQLVVPEKLREPSPVVVIFFERINDDIIYIALCEDRSLFGLGHKLFAPDSATILEA